LDFVKRKLDSQNDQPYSFTVSELLSSSSGMAQKDLDELHAVGAKAFLVTTSPGTQGRRPFAAAFDNDGESIPFFYVYEGDAYSALVHEKDHALRYAKKLRELKASGLAQKEILNAFDDWNRQNGVAQSLEKSAIASELRSEKLHAKLLPTKPSPYSLTPALPHIGVGKLRALIAYPESAELGEQITRIPEALMNRLRTWGSLDKKERQALEDELRKTQSDLNEHILNLIREGLRKDLLLKQKDLSTVLKGRRTLAELASSEENMKYVEWLSSNEEFAESMCNDAPKDLCPFVRSLIQEQAEPVLEKLKRPFPPDFHFRPLENSSPGDGNFD
jgi:hypothetical protein